MKTITNKTILKQGEKIYQPIEVDENIYWVDNSIPLKEGQIRVTYFKDGIFTITKEQETSRIKELSSDKVPYIVAQSQSKLEGIPVIRLDSYINKVAEENWNLINSQYKEGLNPYAHKVGFIEGYKTNPNKWSDSDIEKAINLARTLTDEHSEFEVENILGSADDTYGIREKHNSKEIIEQLNQISIIEVDEQFNIIKYE